MMATTRHIPCSRRWIYALAMVSLLSVPMAAWGGPRFEARWSRNPVRPGTLLDLTVTCRWEGDTGLYAVRPPRPDLPEGLAAGPVSSRSFREGEENVVLFRLEMTAPTARGEIPGFPLHFQVYQAGQKEPFEQEISTEPLRVDVARWKGIPRTAIFLGFSCFVLLLAGTALWRVRRKKNRVREAAPGEEPDRSALLSALREELNACRVRGDTRSFLETALKIHELVSPKETAESRELRDRAEQSRYGNLRLSGEEMEAWTRRLKRLELPADPEKS
jgi:hypothetical protein